MPCIKLVEYRRINRSIENVIGKKWRARVFMVFGFEDTTKFRGHAHPKYDGRQEAHLYFVRSLVQWTRERYAMTMGYATGTPTHPSV